MPDLQSELSTKLSSLSFDDAGQALSQTDSSQEPRSVSQQMFEFIKANPGSSISKIAKQFSSTQHISTRLSQLHKTGVLKRTMTPNGYAYSAACATYPRKRYTRTTKVTPSATQMDVQATLNTLPVATAKALYDELRKIFAPQ